MNSDNAANSPKRVLLTGGAGYLGSVVLALLCERGYRVRVLDSALSLSQTPPERVEFFQGDICDRSALTKACHGIDAVIHLAAVVGYPACDRDPMRARKTNDEATQHLVALTRPQKIPLIFASTCSVYGKVDQVCSEETAARPLTLYGQTKLAAEGAVLRGSGIVLRFATLFGISPRMRYDLLVHALIGEARSSGRIVIFEPHARRALLHIRDAAESCLLALENGMQMSGQIFNVSASTLCLTKQEIAQEIQKALNCSITVDTSRLDPDKRDYQVDCSKIERYGFRAKSSLEEGIREILQSLPKG